MKIKLTETQVKMVKAYLQNLSEGHMKTPDDLNGMANSYLKYFLDKDLFEGDLQKIMRYVYTLLRSDANILSAEDMISLYTILGNKLKNAGDPTLMNFGQQFHYIASNMK